MLPPYEYRIWVDGVPKSQQAKGKHSDGYIERVQAAARAKLSVPLNTRVELTVIYSGWRAPQLDTDNAAKLIQDALKGIAYHDDRQVKDTRVVALREKELGEEHRTFARVLDGNQFLIRLLEVASPTIRDQVESS